MLEVRPRVVTLERDVTRQEDEMRREIDEWAALAAELFEVDTVTQWCIYEPEDRIIYTDAVLQRDEVELLKLGRLTPDHLPYTRQSSTLEDGVRMPEDAKTRVVVFDSTADHGMRGVLMRRYTGDVIYMWSARLPDSKFEQVTSRAAEINERFEDHELAFGHTSKGGKNLEIRINFFSLVESMAWELYDMGRWSKEQLQDAMEICEDGVKAMEIQ